MNRLSFKQKRILAYTFCCLIWLAAFAMLFQVIDWNAIAVQLLSGWGAFAVLDFILAKIKGRSGIMWFLLTLFLGPVALISLLFSRPRQRGQ